MADVIDAVDIVVSCSSTEGVPRTLLEAGAGAVPVVATDVGGVPDVVDDGVTGIICPPGDVRAVEDGIRRLIKDANLRATMGAAARDRIASVFSTDICSRRLIDEYRDLLLGERGASPLKVMHVFQTGGKAYGVERTVLSLLPALTRRGIQVHVVVAAETRWGGMDEHTARQLRECACKVDVIPVTAHLPFGLAKCLRRIVARERPDIVHSHGYKCDIASMLSRSAAAKVATIHGWCSRSVREKLWEWTGVQFEKRMDAVVALSGDYRDRLLRRGVADSRIHVVHAGIDVAALRSGRRDCRGEWGIGRDGVLVVQVGRLSPEKNPQLFVRMAKQVCKRLPQATFVLVGGGPLEGVLSRDVAGSRGRILLAGYVEEIADVFGAADIAVSCSTTEGLPGAVLEAGAMSTPVVATAVGGVPEIIEDGVTGILCPPGDVEELEAGIVRLIEDVELRTNMGAAARQRIAAAFTSNTCAAQLVELYESLHEHAVPVRRGRP